MHSSSAFSRTLLHTLFTHLLQALFACFFHCKTPFKRVVATGRFYLPCCHAVHSCSIRTSLQTPSIVTPLFDLKSCLYRDICWLVHTQAISLTISVCACAARLPAGKGTAWVGMPSAKAGPTPLQATLITNKRQRAVGWGRSAAESEWVAV